jgi:hypothetical protein
MQISPSSLKVNRSTLQTAIINLNHVPTKASWDLAVTKALQMVKGRQRDLVKVSHTMGKFAEVSLTVDTIRIVVFTNLAFKIYYRTILYCIFFCIGQCCLSSFSVAELLFSIYSIRWTMIFFHQHSFNLSAHAFYSIFRSVFSHFLMFLLGCACKV